MQVKKWSIIVLFSLFIAAPVSAQKGTEHLKSSQLISKEKAMNIEVQYALGKFTLNPSLAEEAYVVNIEYPVDLFTPAVDYEIEDDVGYLTVKSNKDDGDEFNIDWEDREENSRWDIEYNPDLPTTMNLEIGLGKGVLELGGAHITELDLENGLSDMTENTIRRTGTRQRRK